MSKYQKNVQLRGMVLATKVDPLFTESAYRQARREWREMVLKSMFHLAWISGWTIVGGAVAAAAVVGNVSRVEVGLLTVAGGTVGFVIGLITSFLLIGSVLQSASATIFVTVFGRQRKSWSD